MTNWEAMTAEEIEAMKSGDAAPVAPVAPVSTGSNMGYRLDEVHAWLSRFISVPEAGDLDVLTLWAAHTHLAFETYTTPRLQIDSTMPGSGKTTVLEHLGRLCVSPVQMASVSSTALLARMLDKGIRTLLIDEVDRSLDPKKPGVEDLIAVLNSGYKRGATRPVLVPGKGGDWEDKHMSTFSPVAMAGNAPALPDDTRSRCIRVLLMPDFDGTVEESDWELIEAEADALGRRLAEAAGEVRELVKSGPRPELPAGCVGRMREKWLPLARIAAAAGGGWPDRVEALILRDVAEVEMEREEGLAKLPPAVVLLKDLRAVWPGRELFATTSDLLAGLIAHNPEYWGPFSAYGKALTAQRLGRLLVQGFKIHSDRLVRGGPRGYRAATLSPLWSRFGLPTIEPVLTGATGATGADNDKQEGLAW